MKCNEQGKIDSYHKGELHGEAYSLISKHLENCTVCSAYLEDLKAHEQVIQQVKNFSPELPYPQSFRNEILDKIEPKPSWNLTDGFSTLFDRIISILVQPVTRYSFITAAVIIFGVFIYQQTIIVQKMDSLEKRLESNIKSGDSKLSNRKNIETFFKKRSGTKSGDMEYNELLDDYRLLLIKHKVLLKTLQKNYPKAYKDLINELEKAELLSDNVNI